ncbi:MAG: ROK family protein [Candidatus Saccharimonadales bacterium]
MYLGIDIGGTKTLIASFDSNDKMIETRQFPTIKDPEELIKKISQTASGLSNHKDVKAIGVAAAGYVSNGLVTNKSTLLWDKVPIQSMLENELKKPILIGNDASLGALYEARVGAGINYSKVLYISLGTGVGSGMVIDGDISESFSNSEAGHIIINRDSSNYHNMESLVSGPAFEKRFNAPANMTTDSDIWDEYSEDLAIGVFNVINTTIPDIVIIGGGMANHYDLFEKPLRKYIDILDTKLFTLPEIRRANEPDMAVVYGCAIIAQRIG